MNFQCTETSLYSAIKCPAKDQTLVSRKTGTMKFAVLISAFFWGLCKGQSEAARGAELTCYECSARPGNNSCTEEFRKKVKALGFDQRCRVFEMNGIVVSQGVVPLTLCTPQALNKVRTQNTEYFFCIYGIFSSFSLLRFENLQCILSIFIV